MVIRKKEILHLNSPLYKMESFRRNNWKQHVAVPAMLPHKWSQGKDIMVYK